MAYFIINPVTKVIVEKYKNHSEAAEALQGLNNAVFEMYGDKNFYTLK
tara:strand:- start:340 stop:483 length:144 start_codon:yes stop_codon:yes gene_type:complete